MRPKVQVTITVQAESFHAVRIGLRQAHQRLRLEAGAELVPGREGRYKYHVHVDRVDEVGEDNGQD